MTWRPGAPVRLETERLLIRSLGREDASERYRKWFHDGAVMGYLDRPMNLARTRIGRMRPMENRERFHLGIFLKDSGLHVGFVNLVCDPVNHRAEITPVIGERDYWGDKVGFESSAAAIDFAFAELDVHKVFNAADSRNSRAIFLAQSLGFRREAIFREHLRRGRDEWNDVCLFALLRQEWREGKGAA